MEDAQAAFPQYNFIKPLTPSEQKAAFHIQDQGGNDLCFKIISPDSDLERLKREIDALQSINHPNVVELVEYTYSSRSDGQNKHYTIEQFIDGHDLADDLKAKWDIRNVPVFFSQLFDGLYAMHSKQIVHRDLKPTNIRVNLNGSPVIIDFGLARHLSLPDITLTRDGTGIGTPTYFAPEQFDGKKSDIDGRTDLFAAGIILYQSLTGSHPFYQAGMSFGELRDKICSSSAHLSTPSFSALPRNMQLLVTKLLEKERANRPDNAQMVAIILRKIGSEGK